MRLNYISKMDDTFASYRYRMLIPGRELVAKGHDVQFSRFFRTATDTVVFSKHFHYPEADTAILCKQQGQKVVFDVCDNHLDDSPHREHYAAMIKLADTVTCSTPELAEVIQDKIGVSSIVISDPYEFAEVEPVKPVLGDRLKLLWFGHASNIDSLRGVWKDLAGNYVMVISGPEAKDYIKHPVFAWSKGTLEKGFKEADAVIIPSIEDTRRKVKSPNRMIESIRQGRFVIANPLPAYEPFREWMWLGGMKEGIEWFRAHLDEVPDRIKAAQAYIRETFSPERIGSEWEKALS